MRLHHPSKISFGFILHSLGLTQKIPVSLKEEETSQQSTDGLLLSRISQQSHSVAEAKGK